MNFEDFHFKALKRKIIDFSTIDAIVSMYQISSNQKQLPGTNLLYCV